MISELVEAGSDRYTADLNDAIKQIDDGVFNPETFLRNRIYLSYSDLSGSAFITRVQMYILRKTLDALNSN